MNRKPFCALSNNDIDDDVERPEQPKEPLSENFGLSYTYAGIDKNSTPTERR